MWSSNRAGANSWARGGAPIADLGRLMPLVASERVRAAGGQPYVIYDYEIVHRIHHMIMNSYIMYDRDSDQMTMVHVIVFSFITDPGAG